MTLPVWGFVVACIMFAVELGGFIVGVTRWRRGGRGQRAITLWLGAAAIFDILEFVALRPQNVQTIANLWSPVSVVLATEALASYQSKRALANGYRVAMGLYLAIWLTLLLTVEVLREYSTYSAPLHALLILGIASTILLRRGGIGRGDILSDPAFLIAAGLSGYAVANAFQTLVPQFWLTDHQVYTAISFATCSLVTVAGELMIIRALLLPATPSARKPA